MRYCVHQERDIPERAWAVDRKISRLLKLHGPRLARAGVVFFLRRFAGLWRANSPVSAFAQLARRVALVDEAFVDAGPSAVNEFAAALKTVLIPKDHFAVPEPRVVASTRAIETVWPLVSLGSGATERWAGVPFCVQFATMVSETLACEHRNETWTRRLASEVRGLVGDEVGALQAFLEGAAATSANATPLTIPTEPSALVSWRERLEASGVA